MSCHVCKKAVSHIQKFSHSCQRKQSALASLLWAPCRIHSKQGVAQGQNQGISVCWGYCFGTFWRCSAGSLSVLPKQKQSIVTCVSCGHLQAQSAKGPFFQLCCWALLPFTAPQQLINTHKSKWPSRWSCPQSIHGRANAHPVTTSKKNISTLEMTKTNLSQVSPIHSLQYILSNTCSPIHALQYILPNHKISIGFPILVGPSMQQAAVLQRPSISVCTSFSRPSAVLVCTAPSAVWVQLLVLQCMHTSSHHISSCVCMCVSKVKEKRLQCKDPVTSVPCCSWLVSRGPLRRPQPKCWSLKPTF